MGDRVNWLKWFRDFFEEVKDRFAVVLGAARCQEAWLQGEMYRHGRNVTMFVNQPGVLEGERIADLFAFGNPHMVGEIKIVSTESTVSDPDVEKDVQRLRDRRNPAIVEAYMVLVIPRSEKRTKSGDRVEKLCYSDERVEHDYGEFKVRIWRIN